MLVKDGESNPRSTPNIESQAPPAQSQTIPAANSKPFGPHSMAGHHLNSSQAMDPFSILNMAAMVNHHHHQSVNPLIMEAAGHQPSLPFMAPNAALAALAFYQNNNKQGLDVIDPLHHLSPGSNPNSLAYQRSYLDALRFYKAAYGSN